MSSPSMDTQGTHDQADQSALTLVDLQSQIAALQETIGTLQSQLTSSNSTPKPSSSSQPTTHYTKGLKVAPPEYFDGTLSKSKSFLNQVYLFLAGKKDDIHHDQDRIILTLSYMKGGTAGPWAEQKVESYSNTGHITQSWEDFVKEFNSVFGDPDPAGTARFKMDRLHQGSQTVDEYVSKFRELKSDTGYNDAALVEKFKKGLNQGLVDRIFGLQDMPTTLKDWETWSSKFDRQWRQRQAEKKAFSDRTNPGSSTQKQAGPTHTSKPTSSLQPSYVKKEPDVVHMEVDSGRKNRPRIVCYRCRQPGHIAKNCQFSVDIGSLDYEGLRTHFEQENQKRSQGQDFQ